MMLFMTFGDPCMCSQPPPWVTKHQAPRPARASKNYSASTQRTSGSWSVCRVSPAGTMIDVDGSWYHGVMVIPWYHGSKWRSIFGHTFLHMESWWISLECWWLGDIMSYPRNRLRFNLEPRNPRSNHLPISGIIPHGGVDVATCQAPKQRWTCLSLKRTTRCACCADARCVTFIYFPYMEVTWSPKWFVNIT
jgi:hypothetical protein